MAEHISRKELKQDKIKETIEHGAEAVLSHGQFAGIVIAVVLAIAIGYGGWHLYIDRQTAQPIPRIQTNPYTRTKGRALRMPSTSSSS